jgi:hypothetical protein
MRFWLTAKDENPLRGSYRHQGRHGYDPCFAMAPAGENSVMDGFFALLGESEVFVGDMIAAYSPKCRLTRKNAATVDRALFQGPRDHPATPLGAELRPAMFLRSSVRVSPYPSVARPLKSSRPDLAGERG